MMNPRRFQEFEPVLNWNRFLVVQRRGLNCYNSATGAIYRIHISKGLVYNVHYHSTHFNLVDTLFIFYVS